ncbi:MAG: AraC family transcriptional regulator [Gemmatimonadaceae bacterium]
MATDHDLASGVVAQESDEPIDVLSDVLRAVRLSGALFFLTDASSPWCVGVPSARTLTPAILPGAQSLVSYHVVTSGRCWCEGPGTRALELVAGDVVVIPHGDAYALSHPAGTPPDWSNDAVVEFFRRMAARELPFVVTEGGGGADRLQVLCGFLGCDTVPFNPVLATLPRILHVPRRPEGAPDRLHHLIDFAMFESREPRAGSDVVLLRIAEVMFIEVVRRHLAALSPSETGWLAGLRDPVVGRALALLHREPGRAWTIELLAREACSSRSVFAERFTQLVGAPPMQYLSRWRLQVAARMLRDGDAKVVAIAHAVGFESEAAFSRAFRRLVGVPPATWRRQAFPSAVTPTER